MNCFWIELDGQRHELGEFPVIVGRDASCDIVVEADALVSRRHACFSALDGVASVEDLRSRNGVRVNGQRIEGHSQLVKGDSVRVGHRLFTVQAEEAKATENRRYGGGETTIVEQRQNSPTADTLSDGDRPSNVDATSDARIFDLLTGVAEKAFRLGNTEEAARVLRPCLELVLDEAQSRGRLDSSSLKHASGFACRLAHQTREGEWFDYLITLHRALKRPPTAYVVDQLYELSRHVRRFDAELLRNYATELGKSRDGLSVADKFLLGRVEGLARAASS